jgi:hypothetical protein
MPIDGRFFQVVEWRNGRPWRGREYTVEADARAAFERKE